MQLADCSCTPIGFVSIVQRHLKKHAQIVTVPDSVLGLGDVVEEFHVCLQTISRRFASVDGVPICIGGKTDSEFAISIEGFTYQMDTPIKWTSL